MKTTLTKAAYESPRTKVLSISPEGLLCASTEKFGWNEDNKMDDFAGDFSDWSK